VDELLYVRGEGPVETWGLLYQLDPRSKLLCVAGLSLALVLLSATLPCVALLAILHIVLLAHRPLGRRLGTFWKALWPMLATIIVLASMRWQAGEVLVAVGPVGVTSQSLWAALGLGARISALSLSISALLWTTQPPDAVAGLVRLGLPFGLGFPAVMALEYVATFRGSFQQILEAQQSRGLLLSGGNPIRAVRTYVPVLIPLLISALRSADSLALALESRGYGSGRRRTSRRRLRFRRTDWWFLGSSGVIILAYVVGSTVLSRGTV
jgi:energy-coupling factor transport system permease protein